MTKTVTETDFCLLISDEDSSSLCHFTLSISSLHFQAARQTASGVDQEKPTPQHKGNE